MTTAIRIPPTPRLAFRPMNSADPANLGSIAVMRKLGMHYVDDREHRTPWRTFAVAYYEMPND